MPKTSKKMMKIINKNKKQITLENLLNLNLLYNEKIIISKKHLFSKKNKINNDP